MVDSVTNLDQRAVRMEHRVLPWLGLVTPAIYTTAAGLAIYGLVKHKPKILLLGAVTAAIPSI